MPVTIMQLAESVVGHEAVRRDEYEEIGLPVFGGCELCHAPLGYFNAHPSRSGYIRCRDCISDLGWESVEEAVSDVFGAVRR
jgi:hypothetical protein